MEIKRLLTNICSHDLDESKNFYTSLFNLRINFESDWFIHLVSADKDFELGIIAKHHDIVPDPVGAHISGIYLTFVVEDIDEMFEKAKKLGYSITQNPQATFYGQNRMLLVAPEGTVCDISSPLKD